MIEDLSSKTFIIDANRLPSRFPTHKHSAEFWEALGRAIATFGFLEEVLGKAIFSFTATRGFPEEELEAEFNKWLPTLMRALSDPLGGLIESYGRAVRNNTNATITNLDDLLDNLRKAAVLRNVLCHGSWRSPDENGKCLPLYVNKKGEVFETPIDVAFLDQVQRVGAELACEVVSTVTHMGWQFPGSHGPGKPIFQSQCL